MLILSLSDLYKTKMLICMNHFSFLSKIKISVCLNDLAEMPNVPLIRSEFTKSKKKSVYNSVIFIFKFDFYKKKNS